MKKTKYVFFVIAGLFFCGTAKHAVDQLIDDSLQIGSDNGQLGEGKRLYFGGISQNGGDPFWISRFDNAVNVSDLRINIADGNGGDRFVIGTNFWQDNTFHPYFVVQNNGRVRIGIESIGDERLAVNGIICSKEVKVEAANWTRRHKS